MRVRSHLSLVSGTRPPPLGPVRLEARGHMMARLRVFGKGRQAGGAGRRIRFPPIRPIGIQVPAMMATVRMRVAEGVGRLATAVEALGLPVGVTAAVTRPLPPPHPTRTSLPPAGRRRLGADDWSMMLHRDGCRVGGVERGSRRS